MLKTVADSVAMAVPLPPSTNEGFFSKSELAWLQAIKRHPLFKASLLPRT
jgi:hypothetical protein